MMVGEHIKAALARTYKAGVKISFGTDMGVGPHGQNAREFALMIEAGMTPADAIKAATVTAAELLDISDVAGPSPRASPPTSSPSTATRWPTSPSSSG